MPSASRPPVVGICAVVAGAQVELALVERAGDEAAVELADRQRRAHVRAAIVGRDDALGRVREQDVEVAEGDAAHRARRAGRRAASTASNGARRRCRRRRRRGGNGAGRGIHGHRMRSPVGTNDGPGGIHRGRRAREERRSVVGRPCRAAEPASALAVAARGRSPDGARRRPGASLRRAERDAP